MQRGTRQYKPLQQPKYLQSIQQDIESNQTAIKHEDEAKQNKHSQTATLSHYPL
jgi:hypothetical protein